MSYTVCMYSTDSRVLKGATRGDSALSLPIQAVQEVAEEYARRSLGWIPFKVRTIRYRGGQVYFAGRWLSLWDSFGLGDFELRAGNFGEDSRGRWYLNVCVPRLRSSVEQASKPPIGAILDRSVPSVGIDLGLKRFAAFSDLELPPRKKSRTRAIHAKIANRRKDFLHNKCDDAGVWFAEVDEAFSTRTCSVRNSRAGPKGRNGLGIRGWQCSVCEAIHDRDANAAQNILAAGHRRLAEGILVP